MAKYASQPSLPTSPAFGAQPNNFSTMGAFKPGQPLPTGPGSGANPYQAPGAGLGSPATAQGIMQTAQGQGMNPQAMPGMGQAPGGMPPAAPAMGKVAGEVITATVDRLLRPMTGNEHRHVKRASATLCEIKDVISRLAAPSIPQGRYKGIQRGNVKQAGMPMGPATAMPPPAPPPMPTQLGVQGMLPPGAVPPGGPGSAPPPGGDPSMGGAPQDPAAAGGAPPPGGMPPGGDPSMGGAAPPPTLNGEVPPLGMPPTPPLPANPRVNPPRQATPEDFQRRQDLNSLLAMDEQVQPDTMAEEIQPDLLASGSKSAFDFVARFAKQAATPVENFGKKMVGQSVSAMVTPPAVKALGKLQRVGEQAAEPISRRAFLRGAPRQALRTAMKAHDEVGDVGRHSMSLLARAREGMTNGMGRGGLESVFSNPLLGPWAANLLPKGTLRNAAKATGVAATGGAVYDLMKKGEDEKQAATGLERKLRSKLKSVQAGVLEGLRDVVAGSEDGEEEEKQAAQDNGPDQHTLQRSCTGESKGLTYQNKPDHYAQGQDAWASVSGYFKGGAKKKPNPFIGKHASCGDELAFKRYKALGYSDEEADRLAGQPLDKQAGVDFGKHDTSFSRMRKLQNRRQPLPEQKDDIGSFSTTFKYAMDKEAAMPPMGKSNMPVIKPGFPLKSSPPPAPYSPGAGVLKGKQDVLKPLKMPTVPASIGAGNRPKLAMDEFKALGLTDFAAAFFARCQIHDVDAGTVKTAMDRVATDYGEVAHAELLDGFTKLAAGRVGLAQKVLGIGKQMLRPATSAVKQTMQAPNFGSHLRTNVTRSAVGGVMGGLTGRQDTGDSVGIPGTEASMPWDWRNAAAGAAAFNPWLNKVNKGGGSMASPLIQGFRGKTMGQFAGSAGDLMAGSLGFDTGGAGSDWGSTIGTGLGVARGGAMALGKVPQLQRFAPQINRAGQAAAQVLSPAARFGVATDDLFAGAVSYPFRAAARGARRMAAPGRFADKAMDWMGFAPATTAKTPLFTNQLKPGNLAGYMGRTLGGVATGVGAGVGAYNIGSDMLSNHIQDNVQQSYNNIRPQMAQDVTNVADTYLNDLGVLSPEGKMQLPMPGGGMGHQLMQMGDQIFRHVGMNPDTMSPAQKISILGGMGLLGSGAMMGSAPVAGLGAMAAGGGMMAGGEQSPLMQLLHHLPRNEYTTQMQQTGQQPPNANPYGPTL